MPHRRHHSPEFWISKAHSLSMTRYVKQIVGYGWQVDALLICLIVRVFPTGGLYRYAIPNLWNCLGRSDKELRRFKE